MSEFIDKLILYRTSNYGFSRNETLNQYKNQMDILAENILYML